MPELKTNKIKKIDIDYTLLGFNSSNTTLIDSLYHYYKNYNSDLNIIGIIDNDKYFSEDKLYDIYKKYDNYHKENNIKIPIHKNDIDIYTILGDNIKHDCNELFDLISNNMYVPYDGIVIFDDSYDKYIMSEIMEQEVYNVLESNLYEISTSKQKYIINIPDIDYD